MNFKDNMDNSLCNWECDWVLNNPQYYEGTLHQSAVISIIRNRYFNNKTKSIVKLLVKNDKSYTELANHLGIN